MRETYNKQEIINLLITNKGAIIDNHDGREERIAGLIELKDNDLELGCAWIGTPYFSINPCYYNDDGNLHCGMASIAGVFCGDLTPENIKKYNDSCTFERMQIKCIHMTDGSVMYPAA